MKSTLFNLFVFVFLFSNSIQASHLIGGDITYTYLGANTYQIKLQVFRDCKDPKDFDNPAAITIYESNSTFIINKLVPLTSRNIISNSFPDSCLIPPAGICVERGVYITTVSLPPSIYGYDISYESCCHNASVLNIQYPQFTGTTMTTHIPSSSNATSNNSVQFDSIPPVFICVNKPFNYNFSVNDSDADSLVYYLCTPLDGLSGNPASPPPYNPISWAAGYSAANPIPSSSGISFNQNTGQLSFTPSMIGQFDICVCVSEYHNGVLINTSRREIQLNAVMCQTTASIINQTTFCNGLTASFNNISTNATSYYWNFGDPLTLSDTSSLTSPTYTYADTGSYTVMLVAINNSGNCRDTSYATFNIYPVLAPTIQPTYTQCLNNNNFSFQLGGAYLTTANFNWSFGSHATPNNSILSSPNNIIFDSIGIYPVSVIVSQNGCADTLQSTVEILQSPDASFYSNDTMGCEPLQVSFINTSSSQTTLQYNWLIGSIYDTITNPNYLFSNSGLYSVQLVVTDTNGCTDTLMKNNYINVHPKPLALANVSPQKTDIISNVNFMDITLGVHSTFFDLGDGNIETQTSFLHTYPEIGNYNWYLIVTNEFGCKDTTNGEIEVNESNLVYIPNAFTPNNDGMNDYFKPVIAYYKTVSFQIFDRWGSSIFKSNNIEAGWDGKFKNENCQQDIYVYNLEVEFLNGETKFYVGTISLIR